LAAVRELSAYYAATYVALAEGLAEPVPPLTADPAWHERSPCTPMRWYCSPLIPSTA
jgi:hypothetical protein